MLLSEGHICKSSALLCMNHHDKKRSHVVCAGSCLSAAAGISRDMCDDRACNEHCSQSSMVLLVLPRTPDVDIGIQNGGAADASCSSSELGVAYIMLLIHLQDSISII